MLCGKRRDVRPIESTQSHTSVAHDSAERPREPRRAQTVTDHSGAGEVCPRSGRSSAAFQNNVKTTQPEPRCHRR
eukprot:3770173-Prymnesium_polylepis.1